MNTAVFIIGYDANYPCLETGQALRPVIKAVGIGKFLQEVFSMHPYWRDDVTYHYNPGECSQDGAFLKVVTQPLFAVREHARAFFDPVFGDFGEYLSASTVETGAQLSLFNITHSIDAEARPGSRPGVRAFHFSDPNLRGGLLFRTPAAAKRALCSVDDDNPGLPGFCEEHDLRGLIFTPVETFEP